ncbi:MAG: RNA pseudouridine synthase [Firmicutes bacterium]|nr:RNA pseudouridine synthase [Bacillota bacterium]
MKKKKLDILYEDKFILIVNKPSNLLTVATDKEKDRTLYSYVFDYLKQKNKNNKVFIVHRLDKDTSGIVMFAKDEKTKFFLQDNWDKFKRNYVAIVNGKVQNKKGVIKSYLQETKTHLTYSVNDKNGKLAITEYEKILENKQYTMLSLNLKTGRKNQIRVQLADMGNPIVGDKKYGIKKDPIRRMALIANTLEFIHPKTKEKIVIDIDIPNSFINLVK